MFGCAHSLVKHEIHPSMFYLAASPVSFVMVTMENCEEEKCQGKRRENAKEISSHFLV